MKVQYVDPYKKRIVEIEQLEFTPTGELLDKCFVCRRRFIDQDLVEVKINHKFCGYCLRAVLNLQ